MEEKKVKIYEMYFDAENSRDNDMGTYTISLVDSPAIIANYMVFSENEKHNFKFIETDKERRIITGAVMIPDMPIKRLNENDEVFYVVAKKETVEASSMRFMKQGLTNAVNVMHKSNLVPEGVFIFESWLTDKQRGTREPLGYKQCPDGTWFVSMKIENDEIYNEFIKTGELRGFSLEGNYRLKEKDEQPESLLNALEKQLGSRNK